ncbi:MAG TPA: hypothetical protein VKR56_09340 [Candidatus Cybelea sp.]|nr:hypothetical protein [Candidatus Cybelea sp.]
MKYDDSVGRIVGFGALALGLTMAGCAGNVSPIGSTSGGTGLVPGAQSGVPAGIASPDKRHRHHRYCAAVTATQNFNGQAIAKRSWILFTSVTQFPGNQNGARVQMKDSKIILNDGLRNYKIKGPDMDFRYGTPNVRLRFNPGDKFALGGWSMKAPLKTAGNDFIDDIAWRVPRALPGNIKNVTWSAKFYSRSDIQQLKWQWGGAVYTRLTDSYRRLDVKPLDDQKYPPYNNDKAGTPERYKNWVTQGATGGGGNNYTGVGGPTVNVTPCR